MAPAGKVRVFFLIPFLGGGGAERVVVRILRLLDRGRFLPVLVLKEKTGVFVTDVPADVPVLDCGGKGAGGRWRWALNFARHLENEAPDVVVSFMWYSNLFAIAARFLTRSKSRLVISERSTIRGSREGFVKEVARRTAIALCYRFADRIVPNSVEMGRQLVECFRIPRGKVVPIPNPVSVDEIAARGEEGSGEGPPPADGIPVVAGMGRLSREKGFDILIRAMGHVRVPCRLLLLGEGPERDRLRALAERVGLSGRVDFAGFRRNPYGLLRRASVFVLPSRYEGFPNALVEAMALGIPCVAARCPTGPEEIVGDDGRSGLLVPVEDPREMASAIERLLRDPSLGARLGGAGREKVREYDSPAVVRRFEALLEEVMA